MIKIHIENSSALQPIFIVTPAQVQAACARHPDLAQQVQFSFGEDGADFDTNIADATALISYKFPTQDLARKAPKLRWIQILGAGVDYLFPMRWLPEGTQVTTNSGAHVGKATESALMAILMANARMPQLFTQQRRHEWGRAFTSSVRAKTLLIVGVGHIGSSVALSAKALGLRVLGIRRSGEPADGVDEMHRPDALFQLLPRADFVLLNLALTSETRGSFDRKVFEAMPPHATLINMSRGGLVNYDDLAQALNEGRIAGAITDVAPQEPLPPSSALWDAPNLIVTPHVLSDDIEFYIPNTLDLFFENVRRHLAGLPLGNVVDESRGY